MNNTVKTSSGFKAAMAAAADAWAAARESARALKSKNLGLAIGDRVMCNGYAGSVARVCDWNTGLVEVRLPGGVVCVGDTECTRRA